MLTIGALLLPTAKVLLWVCVGFAAYAVVLHQLAKAIQPLRLRLATEGETLLAAGTLPADDERDVRMFLDNAYNGWVVVFVMVLMPVAMFLLLIQSQSRADSQPAPDTSKLSGWFALSIFAANPAMGTIAVVEFFVLALLLLIATGSLAALRAAVRRTFHSLAERQAVRATT